MSAQEELKKAHELLGSLIVQRRVLNKQIREAKVRIETLTLRQQREDSSVARLRRWREADHCDVVWKPDSVVQEEAHVICINDGHFVVQFFGSANTLSINVRSGRYYRTYPTPGCVHLDNVETMKNWREFCARRKSGS